ncbi:MAG TPA: chemotaxis protein CheW [Candidatus Acidoferrales bacterium]|nr:chemotaxis protein CheW [Candidatus Acidoferrales bacterium]
MTTLTESVEAAYVLLRLGEQRFAVPAESVDELTGASQLHKFPHTTPLVEGVIVRRKRVVPVRDIASLLTGRALRMHRFYLVVRRRYGAVEEPEAIPVTGDCELLSGVIAFPRGDQQPDYISGNLELAGEQIPLLDLEKLAAAAPQAAGPAGRPV